MTWGWTFERHGDARMNWVLDVKHPDGTEERFLLKPPSCVLGYARDCDFHIYEGSVSNSHARFSQCKDRKWWVEDLGSTNGTWVEDIELKVPLVLTPGLRITFGDVEAVVNVKESLPE